MQWRSTQGRKVVLCNSPRMVSLWDRFEVRSVGKDLPWYRWVGLLTVYKRFLIVSRELLCGSGRPGRSGWLWRPTTKLLNGGYKAWRQSTWYSMLGHRNCRWRLWNACCADAKKFRLPSPILLPPSQYTQQRTQEPRSRREVLSAINQFGSSLIVGVWRMSAKQAAIAAS